MGGHDAARGNTGGVDEQLMGGHDASRGSAGGVDEQLIGVPENP